MRRALQTIQVSAMDPPDKGETGADGGGNSVTNPGSINCQAATASAYVTKAAEQNTLLLRKLDVLEELDLLVSYYTEEEPQEQMAEAARTARAIVARMSGTVYRVARNAVSVGKVSLEASKATLEKRLAYDFQRDPENTEVATTVCKHRWEQTTGGKRCIECGHTQFDWQSRAVTAEIQHGSVFPDGTRVLGERKTVELSRTDSDLSDEFKSAEIRVAGFNELTPEQGRALYAAYTKRGLEITRLEKDRDEWKGLAKLGEKTVKDLVSRPDGELTERVRELEAVQLKIVQQFNHRAAWVVELREALQKIHDAAMAADYLYSPFLLGITGEALRAHVAQHDSQLNLDNSEKKS